MMILQRAPLRLPRAGAVALTVLTLAGGAHVAAGGQLPAPPILTALAAVVGLSAVLLAGRKMTAPRLVGYLGTSQLALHLAFSRLADAGTSGPTGQPHHGFATTAASSVPAQTPAPYEHLAADAGSTMTLLHLAATLLTAILLARGEAALWALAAWLKPLHGISETGTIPPRFRVLPAQPRTVPARAAVPGQVGVRGPPHRFCNLQAPAC